MGKKYLEVVKEDRDRAMKGLKEIASLPKLKEDYTRFLRVYIKREEVWLMKTIHDMNKTIKLEEKKND
ncbi:hypothetical protein PDN49_23700 [Bacillus cereus]|uniref:hypothetical protein n=1 Tax=Bacillus cereus TaxID=1396 RepID=UPI00192D51A4|nr:hypothetical protein [Bacillus cereus]MDA2329839.1 hypothetical protein [Bacillus cereus]MDA2335686.1 hypothetical protein [Bacillus cereus]MDA2357769.1 hypothetical protein [Bacillus cereus]HDR8154449.1 hypothetical protein [Bacillus cereus]